MSNPLIDTAKYAQLPILSAGQHRKPEHGMCVMEAAAWLTGEPFSDNPQCVSPVIAAFCRSWNDTPGEAGEAIRFKLKTYLPRLVGTRGTAEQEEQRAWLATDWLIRACAPVFLSAAGLNEHARALSSLPPQTSAEAVQASAAARAAAWAAAGDAARAAAWAAAWAAVGATARAAAWDAAGAAAWAAVGATARAAVGTTARAAAWDAAGAAAGAAAWAAAGAAARAAATQKLAPYVERCQALAWELLDALIDLDRMQGANQ